MRFEYVPKSPGHKLTLWWGKEGQFSIYIGTNTHPWYKPKFYFFRDK